MTVEVPFERPWGHVKITATDTDPVEVVFDRRVNRVKVYAESTGWVIATRPGVDGAPLPDGAYVSFGPLKWDPAPGLVSRLFVTADGAGKVLHVIGWAA